MYPTAVGQPRIYEGHRIVKAATDRCRKPLRKSTYLALARKSQLGELEAATTIDEHLVWPIDQDIGHSRLAEQRLQWTGADAVPTQRLHRFKDG
jgi:hypothetical protein